MSQIPCYIGTTSAQFPLHGMSPVKGFIEEFIKKALSEFEYDKVKHTYTFICDYVIRDEITHNVIIPVNFLPVLEQFLETHGYPKVFQHIPIDPIKPREMHLKIKDTWKPREIQIEPIRYLLKDPRPRKGISLICGGGKTNLSTYSAVEAGLVTLLVMGSNISQWIKSINDQTNLGDHFTYLDNKKYKDPYKWVKETNAQCKEKGSKLWVLMGSDSFYQLVNDEVMPELFIASTSTLREFAAGGDTYKNLPWNYQGFVKAYGIGTKIVDEAHQNFHAINYIDLISNIKNNWYLTASFLKTGIQASRIFNTVYPPDMQYGNSENEPYTNVTFYAYNGGVPAHAVIRRRGYNAIKYEQYLLKRPTRLKAYLDGVVLPEVYGHYVRKRNPGEKCLMFFSTKAMIMEVKDYLNKELAKYKIRCQEKISGVPADVFNDPKLDIYLGTPGGCGTGVDIKNLRTAINFVSMDSKVLIKQSFGRLRRIPGVDTEWVDNVDRMIDSQVRHYYTRDRFYRKAAKTYHKVKLS